MEFGVILVAVIAAAWLVLHKLEAMRAASEADGAAHRVALEGLRADVAGATAAVTRTASMHAAALAEKARLEQEVRARREQHARAVAAELPPVEPTIDERPELEPVSVHEIAGAGMPAANRSSPLPSPSPPPGRHAPVPALAPLRRREPVRELVLAPAGAPARREAASRPGDDDAPPSRRRAGE